MVPCTCNYIARRRHHGNPRREVSSSRRVSMHHLRFALEWLPRDWNWGGVPGKHPWDKRHWLSCHCRGKCSGRWRTYCTLDLRGAFPIQWRIDRCGRDWEVRNLRRRAHTRGRSRCRSSRRWASSEGPVYRRSSTTYLFGCNKIWNLER